MQHAPLSSHLILANLPGDLRDEGARLRAEYFALLGEADLLTQDGAVDLGKLTDLGRVKSVNLATLRQIEAAAEGLAALDALRYRREEHTELQDPFRLVCPIEEYSSPEFAREAAAHGFSPYQWVQVRTVVRQAETSPYEVPTDLVVTPEMFTPNGPRKLIVQGDLQLYGRTELAALPNELVVMGILFCTDCSTLASLPPDLTAEGGMTLGATLVQELPEGVIVHSFLDVVNGTAALQTQAMEARRIGKLTCALRVGGASFLPLLKPGLVVPGELDLSYCADLRTLPEGLTVEGRCIVEGSRGLDRFPANFKVYGNLEACQCSADVIHHAHLLKTLGQIGGDVCAS